MSAPWMNTGNEDAATHERETAQAYVEHIGSEYARLRAWLLKSEQSKDNNEAMDAMIPARFEKVIPNYSKQYAGKAAMLALDVLAKQLQRDNPGLTKEQAFTRVYTDRKYANLQRAEREAAYEAMGFNSVRTEATYTKNTSTYDWVRRKAEELHEADPSKSVEQHFSAIYCEDSEFGKALRRADRADNGTVYG